MASAILLGHVPRGLSSHLGYKYWKTVLASVKNCSPKPSLVALLIRQSGNGTNIDSADTDIRSVRRQYDRSLAEIAIELQSPVRWLGGRGRPCLEAVTAAVFSCMPLNLHFKDIFCLK